MILHVRACQRGTVGASGFLAVFLLLGFVLWVPASLGDTWTETAEPDFLGGTLADVAVTPGGDVILAETGVPFATKRGVVLDHGAPGAFDGLWTIYPFVLRETDGTYKMWYTGFDGARYRMMFADSPDGVTWTKRGVAIDVLTPPLNFDSVSGMSVLKDGATYHMWFAGGYWSGGPVSQVYYATSPNGLSWSIQSPVLGLGTSGSWDDSQVAQPRVVRGPGGMYHLYYSGWDGSSPGWRIGLATSSTYTAFLRYGNSPILDAGSPGAWDDVTVALSAVVVGSRMTMYYGGSDGAVGRMGVAFSDDGGYAWTKWSGNPWLAPDPVPAWDAAGIGLGSHAADPSGGRLYYAGLDGTYFRIGYAALASSFATSGSYTSRTFDSGGAGTTWQTIAWGETTPAGTAIALSVRAGDSPTPDGSWTAWAPVVGPPSGALLTLPRSRFAQYQAQLSTSNASATPELHDVTVTYDPNGAPSVSSLTPSGSMWLTNPEPTFTWTVADPEADSQAAFEVQVSRDSSFANYLTSGVRSGPSTSWQSPPLGEGAWSWRVRVADAFGAWGGWEAEEFGIDLSPPATAASLDGTVGGAGWFTSAVSVQLTASDSLSGVASSEYRIEGGEWQSYLDKFSITGDGFHAIEFRSEDRAGHREEVRTVFIGIDMTPPAATVFLLGERGASDWFVGPVAVSLAATDEASGVEMTRFRIDGGGWQSYGVPPTISGQGAHVVEFFSTDAAGLEETARSVEFRIDTVAPVTAASLSGSQESDTYVGAVTVTLTASDDGSGVAVTKYRVDGGDWQTYPGPIQVSTEGTHIVEFYSADAAGLQESARFVSFRIRAEGANPSSLVDSWLLVLLAGVIVGFLVLAFLFGRKRRQTIEPPPPPGP